MEKAAFHVETIQEAGNTGVFAVYPLPRGFGHTMGNVLRRVLLSSLTGTAISYVKIKGVSHSFVALKGVKEDVLSILLNLKLVRFAYEGTDEQKLVLKKKGKGIVTAADIDDSAVCKVVNKDLYIAELANDGELEIELIVDRGAGYVPSEEKEEREYGMLALDSLYSPVTKVSADVEGARVGRKTNFDKLVLNLTTDGSITPREALNQAGMILVNYFQLFIEGGMPMPKVTVSEQSSSMQEGKKEEGDTMMVDELDLPTRVINALIKHGVETVGQLSKMTDEDFGKVRGLGKKSVEELKVKLTELNLS